MNILLRYNNNDDNMLLFSSPIEESFNNLLKYLDRCGIAYVDSVPTDKSGLFCVPQKDTYMVYQSVFDKEDNTYNAYLIYYLQWLIFSK